MQSAAGPQACFGAGDQQRSGAMKAGHVAAIDVYMAHDQTAH